MRTYTYGVGAAGPHAVTSIVDNAGPNMAFGYDAGGNMTSRDVGSGAETITFQPQGQLSTHTQGGVTSTMRYDTNGIRIRQHDGTVDTLYADKWWETTAGTDTHHYFIDGDHVAVATGTAVDYLFTDHVDSVTSAMGASGYDKNRYHPFGSPRDTLTVDATDHAYTGQRGDSTGLAYYNARYYDPHIGRFIQPDTIIPNPANPQDFNRYTYVNNNPINYNDPTGHFSCMRCVFGSAQRPGTAAQVDFISGGRIIASGESYAYPGARIPSSATTPQGPDIGGAVIRFWYMDPADCLGEESTVAGCTAATSGLVCKGPLKRICSKAGSKIRDGFERICGRFCDDAAETGLEAAPNGVADDFAAYGDEISDGSRMVDQPYQGGTASQASDALTTSAGSLKKMTPARVE